MRMLDSDRQQSVKRLQLYLDPGEAARLRDFLDELLQSPGALLHHHLESDDEGRDLSVSLVTERKLQVGKYTQLEREVLGEL